jgi:F0F1-type ATP synthase assembly protein I
VVSPRRDGYNPFDIRHDDHWQDSHTMRISKQFFGGVLVGLAIGMLLGAALVEGQKKVNYTKIAGVGVILVTIAGVVIARAGPPKT